MEEYLGVIKAFGFPFAPRGWAQCDGQLMSISANTALYSLLGTTFGGNGQSTFGLPDLRGRTLIGQGQGPSLQPYNPGQMGGTENVTLTTTQLPAHTHSLQAYSTPGTTGDPTNALLAHSGSLDPEYSQSGTTTTMSPQAISAAGGNQGHPNMQPYLVINYCISLVGIFPSRN